MIINQNIIEYFYQEYINENINKITINGKLLTIIWK
jgi:hypothetical protein